MSGARRARRRARAGLVLAIAAVFGGLTGSAEVVAARADASGPQRTGARLSPELRRSFASLDRAKPLTVIVTMRAQVESAPRPPIAGGARALRTVSRLRSEAAGDQRAIRRRLAAGLADGDVRRFDSLWIFNGLIVRAGERTIRALAARRDVAAIDPNRRIVLPAAETRSTSAEPNIALTGAPALWARGITGEGVVVAGLDTGVDVAHPDLASRWRGGANSWFDPNGEHPSTPVDVDGHGTSTMGVIVGGDAGGSSIGMAPGASWIAAKIFNDHGVATTAGIHRAFQWLLDPDGDPETADAPDIVNNSWQIGAAPACDLSFELDLESLRAAGILPVFAAGNSGPGAATAVSPANNPAAFAVGSIDDDWEIAESSSRGPSNCGEPSTTFPELVAPGVGIRTADLFGDWRNAGGTSLAAPHVAGALALLAEAHPGLNADRQALALVGGATDLGEPGADPDFGWGALDVPAADGWLGPAADFSLSAAPRRARAWPGETAAYTVSANPLNGLDQDLDLSLAGLDPAQASWGFTPPTVAAAGSSLLEVMPAPGIAPGRYPLTVGAAGGGLAREVEVILRVPAPRDFSLAVTPLSKRVTRGDSASFEVAIAAVGRDPGLVRLSASGVPPFTRARFSSKRLSVGEASTLTVRTTRKTPLGAAAIEIAASTRRVAHAQQVMLTVR